MRLVLVWLIENLCCKPNLNNSLCIVIIQASLLKIKWKEGGAGEAAWLVLAWVLAPPNCLGKEEQLQEPNPWLASKEEKEPRRWRHASTTLRNKMSTIPTAYSRETLLHWQLKIIAISSLTSSVITFYDFTYLCLGGINILWIDMTCNNGL